MWLGFHGGHRDRVRKDDMVLNPGDPGYLQPEEGAPPKKKKRKAYTIPADGSGIEDPNYLD